MPYRYGVRQAFAHEGKWYSRRNADEIPALPRAIRDPLLERGAITETHESPADAEAADTQEE